MGQLPHFLWRLAVKAVKWFYLFLLPIIGMQILEYTQGCKWLRITKNLLGLNSGPQKIFDLKIVLLNFPPQTFGLSYLVYYCVKQLNWFILSVLKCKIPEFSGAKPQAIFFSYKYLRFLGSVEVWFLVWNGAKMDHSECFEVQNSKNVRGCAPKPPGGGGGDYNAPQTPQLLLH